MAPEPLGAMTLHDAHGIVKSVKSPAPFTYKDTDVILMEGAASKH